MGSISDQQAAERAASDGELVTVGRRQTIYTMEPARFRYPNGRGPVGRLCANPGIWSSPAEPWRGLWMTWGAPSCPACGAPCWWTGPPRRAGGLWIYALRTPQHLGDCPACSARGMARLDFVRSAWPLVVGGTVGWWESMGWNLNL